MVCNGVAFQGRMEWDTTVLVVPALFESARMCPHRLWLAAGAASARQSPDQVGVVCFARRSRTCGCHVLDTAYGAHSNVTMNRPNKLPAVDAAMTLLLRVAHHWRGTTEAER
jgi:hypothetical protein